MMKNEPIEDFAKPPAGSPANHQAGALRRESGLMTLGEHLDELRRRVVFSLLALVAAVVACWFFKEPLLRFIMQPHIQTMRQLGLPETLRAIRYQEGFYAYLRIAIAAGVFLSSPFIIYQLWAFISSALYPRERKWVYRLAPISVVLFLAGMAFGFYVLIPMGLLFLAGMGQSLLEPMITIGTYLPLVLTLTLATGLVFEMPLVMVFPAKLGLVTAGTYRKMRRYAIVLNLFIAAVVTPTPDPFTQLIMALPMILLYEFGIIACERKLKHILAVAGLVVLLGLMPVGLWLYGQWQDMRAGKIVAGAGEVARVIPTGLAAHVVPAENNGVDGYVRVGDEWTPRDNQVLGMALGANNSLKLRPGGKLKMIGRSAVRLLAGELWAQNANAEEPLRLVTDEALFTLRGSEADLEIAPDGVLATAVRGEVTYSENGGPEARISAGNQKFFPRRQQQVNVAEKTEWLRAAPQQEKSP
jgi:sec-independent protein translocase protein TatC